MGRELKRVPLDFKWPLNKIWEGFINPHCKKCAKCDGTGRTTAHERLSDLVSLLMLSGEDSIKGKNHPYFDSIQKTVFGFNSIPSSDLAELTNGLSGREMSFMGHDACDRWTATNKIIKAAGLSKNWGTCTTCKGHRIDPSVRLKYTRWKEKEPPTGDGYQLWTTTNEGAPISPVFSTLKELCGYAAENCTTFAYNKTSKENWENMLNDGFVAHKEGNLIFT